MSDTLCTSCNLCCNGAIFGHVEVSQDERARLGGEDFFNSGGRLFMQQGCARQGCDGRCAVYEMRPQTCRDYDCALLQKLDRGSVEDAAARELIAATKAARRAFIDAVSETLPGVELPQHMRDTPSLLEHLDKAEAAATKLNFVQGIEQVARARAAFEIFWDLVEAHFKAQKPETLAAE